MKKTIMLAMLCVALFALSLGGCVLREGDVYIQLGWYYTPDTLYSSDPSLQRMHFISAFTNYPTEPGTYYLTYHHAETGRTHYIYYTLSAHEGVHPFEQGPDAIFEIYCWENANNPDFMQLRSITAPSAGSSKGVTLSAAAAAGGTEVQQFQYTRSAGGYDLLVRGGLLE
jgi:hypothetical protein